MAASAPRVIVGVPYWTLNGVSVFSENLARGLLARGMAAEILVTEEGFDRITIADAPMPRPGDIPMKRLPVPGSASWGRHWGAMLRYLEDRAPCVYIPNFDWRHSSVSPLLSNGVHVVGVVHSDDPLHYDHVRRLGPYWDAIVATSQVIARKTIAQAPEVSGRTEVIPIGVNIPAALPRRSSRPGQPLRVIYPGTLRQDQKRVLDLPKIVEAAARRQVPMTLTIAGGGPDEVQLREACAPFVAGGLIEFLGVVEHGAILKVMEAHDVFILTSEFEGLPNALLEAMGRGCVPLVTDIESGIPDVVHEGVTGYCVPVGDIEAFVDRLDRLARDVEHRRQMSAAAHAGVLSGRFRVEDMVDSYAGLFTRLMRDARSSFTRPRGLLSHPPAEIGGVGVFPVALDYDVAGVGAFPSSRPDYREFLDEVCQLSHPERSGLFPLVQERQADTLALEGVRVIFAAPTWQPSGMVEYFGSLVRGLAAAGMDARILLTEDETDLIRAGDRVPVPHDIPFDRLPVRRDESWGGHWGAMVRYLEDLAPCIYIPGYDWRHSVVSPLLSDRVAILGFVPGGDDPMHYNHVQRLGAFWNAVVTPNANVARRLADEASVSSRVHLIQYTGPGVIPDYLDLFRELLRHIRTGAFRRPRGTFAPPPRSVADTRIFWSDATVDADTVLHAGSTQDDRDFWTHIRALKDPD